MSPILERTEWYKSYSGQVQGALKAACMRDGAGSCVAVCLDGGPVSRVESRNMVPNSPSDSVMITAPTSQMIRLRAGRAANTLLTRCL